MSAYRDVFLSESAEYLQSMTDGLLELEGYPDSTDAVETIFRGAHSLKGMAGAMGYEATTELTHKMESAMASVRGGERRVDTELVDLMLRALDVTRTLISEEAAGSPPSDTSSLVAELLAAAERVEEPAAPGPTPADAGDASDAVAGVRRVRVRVTLEEGCALKAVRAYMVMKRLGHLGRILDTAPSAQEIEDERFGRTFEVLLETRAGDDAVEQDVLHVSDVAAAEVLSELAAETAPEVATAGEAARDGATTEGRARAGAPVTKLAETQTVRVSIGHLDNLVNLVGELVILRARLERLAASHTDRSLAETVEDLQRTTSELQHEVMQTRMVPVGNIFNRFPRMVRDLARDMGKDVAFEIEGADIELDRTVLDEIGDPIVHLLRNSVDHGVESPAERVAAGKPPRATIRLGASRERDFVSVTVSDDGRGMDVGRIWAKAVERGLVNPADRDSTSERDILMLACSPGFSTLDEATAVSGRGVGMDVVKGKIEYLGGSLEARTTQGQGTWFSLSLPLTLAIVQALLVGCDGQVYAVALSSVSEVFSPGDVRVETVDGRPVVVIRTGEVVPLYPLSALLDEACDSARMPDGDEQILLVSHGDRRSALLVDYMVGRQEIVIKPLSGLFRDVRGIGGAALLGDGRVALILDPRTLFPTRGDAR